MLYDGKDGYGVAFEKSADGRRVIIYSNGYSVDDGSGNMSFTAADTSSTRLNDADYEQAAARNKYLAGKYDSDSVKDWFVNLFTGAADNPANVLTDRERLEHEGLTAMLIQNRDYRWYPERSSPLLQRLDAGYSSPFASTAYLIAHTAGASQQTKDRVLFTVAGASNILTSVAMGRTSGSAFTGARRMPEVVGEGLKFPELSSNPSGAYSPRSGPFTYNLVETGAPRFTASSLTTSNAAANTTELSVRARANVAGQVFEDINPTLRTGADSTQRTFIADFVEAKPPRQGGYPNTNMGNAHAEIGTTQQIRNAGIGRGADVTMEVTGLDVCGFCQKDLVQAAIRDGYNSLTVRALSNKTGLPKTYYWEPGMDSFKVTKTKVGK